MADTVITDDLLEKLRSADTFTTYDEETPLMATDLPSYLEDLLVDKGLSKADAIRSAHLNETFGYQIFAGTRNPSRNKVIQLAFGMNASFTETQRMLKRAGANELYVKNRRDAIIIFCIDHGFDLNHANDELFKLGEATVEDAAV